MNVKKELASSLRLCAWGMIFLMLDINISVFDILPDVFGWVLLLVGVQRLAKYRQEASHLRVFALVLIINETFVLVGKMFGGEVYEDILALTLLIYVISLYFYFAFFTCAANIADEYAPEIKSPIIAGRNVYSVLFCFNTLLMFFEDVSALSVVSLIVTPFALVGIGICLFSLAKELASEEDEDENAAEF